MTADGETSWFDFAKRFLRRLSTSRRNSMVYRGDPPSASDRAPDRRYCDQGISDPACRPPYSVLSNARLAHTFRVQLPDWRTQLRYVFTYRFQSAGPTG